MSKKKPLPTVVLHPVFVRDHQRRMRLVIDLLEEELNSKGTLSMTPHSQSPNEKLRAIAAVQSKSGGEK